MMALIFDGLIVFVIMALIWQILRVERRLRRMQVSFGAMRGLLQDFSAQVDASQTLFDRMRTAGETVGQTLEQSMEACARQNRELRVLLAHCRRAERRLRAASSDAARANPELLAEEPAPSPSPASIAPKPPAPTPGAPLSGAPLSGAPLSDPASREAAVTSFSPPRDGPLRRWVPPAPSAAGRPDVQELLASMRNYTARDTDDDPAPMTGTDGGARP